MVRSASRAHYPFQGCPMSKSNTAPNNVNRSRSKTEGRVGKTNHKSLRPDQQLVTQGKALRKQTPRSDQGLFKPASIAATQSTFSNKQPRRPRAPSGADSLWPDATVAVRVLSRQRGHHGGRSGSCPGDRTCGCRPGRLPPAELRRLCHARATAGFQRQRLRRNPLQLPGNGTSSDSPRVL